jgi:hypothetical protein
MAGKREVFIFFRYILPENKPYACVAPFFIESVEVW